MVESAVVIHAGDHQLAGVLHQAEQPKDVAVLVIVGGPQTRIGSHRQFVLLARQLALGGYSTMRFDYYGMGDSEGEQSNYLDVSDDVGAAIEKLKSETGAKRVVLWGLCDAVTSSLLYCLRKDCADIAGIIMLNPWVRSEQTEAQAMAKHYYLQRLRDPAFWRKLLRFDVNFNDSFGSLIRILRSALKGASAPAEPQGIEATTAENYVTHMLAGLQKYRGRVLLVLSGDDLTASEFQVLVKGSDAWQSALDKTVTQTVHMHDANHTFSTATWREQVEKACLAWLDNTI